MITEEVVDLSMRIGRWAEENFGVGECTELHVILPLLGIVEELGEAEDGSEDALYDAVADAAIYALDLIYRLCGGNREAIVNLVCAISETTRGDVAKLGMTYVVRPESGLARAFLKRIQGIRSFDNDTNFRRHVRVCLAGLFHRLCDMVDGDDVFSLARSVFERVVSKRDWKANPENGVK